MPWNRQDVKSPVQPLTVFPFMEINQVSWTNLNPEPSFIPLFSENIFFFFCLLVFLSFFLGLHLQAHGRSQARGQIKAVAASLCHIQATSATYITAPGNARSLAYQARPGIELASSWILVGFITTEAQWNSHLQIFFKTLMILWIMGLGRGQLDSCSALWGTGWCHPTMGELPV